MTTARAVVIGSVCIACVKILLIPSYRSTDFDVHRNWLSLTRHEPLSEWYFDSLNGTTVHTLDYPPTFAYFEYILSRNAFTEWLLRKEYLDSRCLARLPDHDNQVSDHCVVFHRLTVVLSDVVLWWGAWLSSTTFVIQPNQQWFTFLLIFLHPSFIWLDHVHFQYNGMLLGLLLGSLAMIERGIRHNTATKVSHIQVCAGAALYSLLLTMKHLYVPLAPLYLVFLLRHYCVSNGVFHKPRFLALALTTATCLLVPFVPFASPQQLAQILRRLFPFGRGLVHDYWAANVWALYMFADKILRFATNRVLKQEVALPDVPPLVAALCLLVAILPAMYAAWQPNNTSTRRATTSSLLLPCVVQVSFASFIWAYHVHEKAILTALIPLAILASQSLPCARLYVRTCCFGLLGLWPILFRPVELSMKVSSHVAYIAFVVYGLQQVYPNLLTVWDYYMGIGLLAVALFLEVIHPIWIYPRMEFLPLLLISTSCATGLVLCWLDSLRLLSTENSIERRKHA